ncbi:MAG: type II toxin-antitoxin system Phd/YefM family antitoxin [Azoarcus sp.]|jgi:prevent-host-death family protein|nr:type II toxin-antitoxin system Phd/YefM family antitoxin [Azoarcus sp.]
MSAHPATWPVQNAKARFSELLDVCMAEGPQTITRRGVATAVLVPFEQWQRLDKSEYPTLKDLLLSDKARYDDLGIPPREPLKMRPPPVF